MLSGAGLEFDFVPGSGRLARENEVENQCKKVVWDGRRVGMIIVCTYAYATLGLVRCHYLCKHLSALSTPYDPKVPNQGNRIDTTTQMITMPTRCKAFTYIISKPIDSVAFQ